MLRRLALTVSLLVAVSALHAQTLSPKWEELTAPDFVTAIHQSQNTCVLPFGILEKHGPSGPIGTDLIDVRYITTKAVQKEYALMFPEYYVGQIFEARHQPGAIAYSSQLQLQMLQETVSEMGRNGCHKILIASGHGGNTNLLNYFLQIQLSEGWTRSTILGRAGMSGVPGAIPVRLTLERAIRVCTGSTFVLIRIG